MAKDSRRYGSRHVVQETYRLTLAGLCVASHSSCADANNLRPGQFVAIQFSANALHIASRFSSKPIGVPESTANIPEQASLHGHMTVHQNRNDLPLSSRCELPRTLRGKPMPASILLVEDNPITRKVVRIALRATDFNLIEADSGLAAIAAVQACSPSLVLQDLFLPDMDGYDLFKRLRSVTSDRFPIVAFTGMSNTQPIMSLGFSDVLVKPVSPSELVRRVYALLECRTRERGSHPRRLLLLDRDMTRADALSRDFERHHFSGLQSAVSNAVPYELSQLQAEHHDLLRSAAVGSMLVIPVALDGQPLGVMVAGSQNTALPVYSREIPASAGPLLQRLFEVNSSRDSLLPLGRDARVAADWAATR